MKKKICALLLATLLLFGFLGSAWASPPELQRAPVNPEFTAWQEALRTSGTNKWGGAIPSPVDLSHIKGPIFQTLEASAYPSAYDLRNVSGQNYVTAVRDQDPFGTCWAFGSLASLESTTLRNKQGVYQAADPDYSEWHLSYFAYNNESSTLVSFTKDTLGASENSTFDQGGNVWQSTAILARWTGAVDETDCPYWTNPSDPNDNNPPASALPTGTEPDARLLTATILLGQDYSQDDVKYALVNYGACAIRITVPYGMSSANSFWNPATNAYYSSSYINQDGHIVTIVGWDDTYSSSNFASTPPGNGAWIVKNSWGTSWGDQGYFYISYYDASLGYPAIFLGNDLSTYTSIYQYDPLGWVGNYGYSSTSASFANVFTAGTGSTANGSAVPAATYENLKAVSFYTAAMNSTYEIRVYTGVTGSPATGTLVYGPEVGTLSAPGYRTVNLTQDVVLTSGEKFAVTVKLTTPSYNFPIPLERADTGYSDKATASAGQSYISANGSTWTDLTTASGHSQSNVALKAFTVPYSGPTPTTAPTGSPTVTVFPTWLPTPTPGGSTGGGGCDIGSMAPWLLVLLVPLFYLKK